MSIQSPTLRAAGAMLLALALALPVRAADAATGSAAANAVLVRAAFDAWRDGTGSVFDLLADDVEWQVAGSSPVSGIYRGRQAFMARAVQPINARLSTPITPEVRHVVAQDDAVVVLWDGIATARDGSTYRNSYAWHMVLDRGRVVRVVAFLDTWALDALMR
ncbi:nuclear transport factor 2 family protein [Luteimonas sp. BDR2-5]|uniref:nuclear transport factor 2 family protein n=1 Tax=Proluteimonas luteida TaxID=2878685 RepID=UPI001E2FF671|nr:nuclear transport factor 2 family protein [Luteimonas sp. BDR2-5]MCD9029020.1 nuclear transport factor 2 family protein [Luteimonas sp. BDR2-5]